MPNDKEVLRDVKNDKKSAIPSARGKSGLNYYGEEVYEEFLTVLRGNSGVKVYREMSDNDPVVGAIIFSLKVMIQNAKWTVQAGGDTMHDKFAKKFLEQNMEDMDSPFGKVIAEALTMAIYGWSYHEVLYKKRVGKNTAYPDGLIGWKGIPARAQSTFDGWDFDEITGELKGMWQSAPPHYRRSYIPINRAVLFRTEETYGNPEGRSLLRNAYRPWYFKKHIEEIEAIGIERNLAGFPVLTAPPEANIWDSSDPKQVALLDYALSIVTGLRRDQLEGVVLPNGWELKLLSSDSGSRTVDTNQVINRLDNRIAISMLSDIVLLGSDKVGSFALASIKKSMLAVAMETLAKSIADSLNKHAVKQLFDINGLSDRLTAYPKIVPQEIEVPSLEELGKFINSLTGANIDLTDQDTVNFLRNLGDMPELTEEQYKKMKEEAMQGRQDITNIQQKSTKPNNDPAKKRENEAGKTGEVNAT